MLIDKNSSRLVVEEIIRKPKRMKALFHMTDINLTGKVYSQRMTSYYLFKFIIF